MLRLTTFKRLRLLESEDSEAARIVLTVRLREPSGWLHIYSNKVRHILKLRLYSRRAPLHGHHMQKSGYWENDSHARSNHSLRVNVGPGLLKTLRGESAHFRRGWGYAPVIAAMLDGWHEVRVRVAPSGVGGAPFSHRRLKFRTLVKAS